MRKFTLIEWAFGGVIAIGLLIALILSKGAKEESIVRPPATVIETAGVTSPIPTLPVAIPPSKPAQPQGVSPSMPTSQSETATTPHAAKPAPLPDAVKRSAADPPPKPDAKTIIVPIIVPISAPTQAASKLTPELIERMFEAETPRSDWSGYHHFDIGKSLLANDFVPEAKVHFQKAIDRVRPDHKDTYRGLVKHWLERYEEAHRPPQPK